MPGSFLAPTLPYLLIPSVALYAAARTLGIVIPTWVLPAAFIVSVPFALSTYSYWSHRRAARRALANGAVLVPEVESKDPFGLGLDILKRAGRDWESRYNGAGSL